MVEINRSDALFLDFDGTLADIVAHPDLAVMPQETAKSLSQLSKKLQGAIAIVSGRDITDLTSRTPTDLWRVGGHGLQCCAPGESPSAVPPDPDPELERAFSELAESIRGAWLERKGAILTLHYRAAPEHGDAIIRGARCAVSDFPSYRIETGKMIVEAKPANANKGLALKSIMDRTPFRNRRPIAVGDDTTDEDLFSAAQAIGGIGIKVGEGDTCANERLASPADVRLWLKAGASP